MRRTLALMLLVGAPGCKACFEPSIPNPPDSEEEEETADEEETGETGPIDTTPPPPCDQPEVEPNSTPSTATEIEMELWACGAFTPDSIEDIDRYTWEMPEANWMEIRVEAATMGSRADPVFTLEGDDGTSLAVVRSADSTDPYVLFPVAEATEFGILMKETSGSAGEEDFNYQFMASMAKPPLNWTHAEAESHDSIETAQQIDETMLVFGTVDSTTGFDYYAFEVPEGRTQVTARVLAQEYGSPLDARLQLYTLDEDGDDDLKYTQDDDPNSSLLDPEITWTSDGAETLYFKVRYRPTTQVGQPYWYVFDIKVESAE